MFRIVKVAPVLFILALLNACSVGMQVGIGAPSGGGFFGTPPILVTNAVTSARMNIAFIDIVDQCNRIQGRLKVGETRTIRATNFSCVQGDRVTLLAKGYQVAGADTAFVGMVTRTFYIQNGNANNWEINMIPIRR